MKWRIAIPALLSLGCAAWAKDAPPVEVMTFNIRHGKADDGANRWSRRKDLLVKTVRAASPDLLGTQETLAEQRDFLASQLPGYAHFAAGRDDGKESGEMTALFWKTDRFEKLDGGHFWLSESPDTPGSRGWDAALPRMATWVKLRDKSAASKPILFLNTHLDHQGEVARRESAKLIRARIARLGQGCSVLVTGDFNCGENSPAYDALFSAPAGDASALRDAYRLAHPGRPAGEGTFNAFDSAARDGARIDWIGCGADWSVTAAVIDHTVSDGRTPSDHFPVRAQLRR